MPYTGTPGHDTFSGTIDNDTANGLGGHDVLSGSDGDDVIDGGDGNDTLAGAKGNDTYVVASDGDVAIETSSLDGKDLVLASVSYALGNLIEDLTLTGSDNLDGTGNALSNVLTGNAGVNVLNGGAGHDTYYVQNTGDTIVETSGNDLVYSAVSFVLGDGVDDLRLQGSENLSGTGNDLSNLIVGNAGNNYLDGGTGFDILHGGAGDDTIVTNSYDEVSGGEGIDTLLTSVSIELDVGEDQHGHVFSFETVIVTGSEDLYVYAGGSGNQSFYGNVGSNDLDGGDGNDQLDGGAGNDHLRGADGADLFLFALNSDQDDIQDFSGLEGDRIDVSAYTVGVADTGAVSQVGSHTVIDLGDGNLITVNYTLVSEVLPYIVW